MCSCVCVCGGGSKYIFLLIGLQSILRPPNRNKELSDTAVSVCHDLPTGMVDVGVLEKAFYNTVKEMSWKRLGQCKNSVK